MVSPKHMHVSYASKFLGRGKEPPHPSAYRKTPRWHGLFALPPSPTLH